MIQDFRGEYRFLSNYEPSEIVCGGILYPTVEHAFQAAKTFDHKDKITISHLTKPHKAKMFGQTVSLRPDWEMVKVDVMRECLIKKFKIPELQEKLLSTGNQFLVEGNTWNDKFWGVCNGEGRNWLGHILMCVREQAQLGIL